MADADSEREHGERETLSAKKDVPLRSLLPIFIWMLAFVCVLVLFLGYPVLSDGAYNKTIGLGVNWLFVGFMAVALAWLVRGELRREGTKRRRKSTGR